MNSKAKWIAAAVLALALVAGGAWAFSAAQEPDEPGLPEEPMAGALPPMGPEVGEQLGLSAEQSEKLRQLWVEAMKNNIRTRSNLMVARIELEELLRADTPDRAAIDSKLRQLTEAQGALLRQHIDQRLAMQAVLTPEQRAKARTLIRQHMRQRFFQRRGMGGFAPGRGRGPRRGMGPGPGGPPQD